jgi:molecular chaperone GrpE
MSRLKKHISSDEPLDDQDQINDGQQPDTSAPDDAVQALQQQIGELTQALQRERADAMNVRRRSEEERAKLGEFYKALVVRELLPVIDNFERALKHVPADLAGNDYVKGVQGVVKQFEQVIEKLGVQKIVTVGQPFDPRLHEAVSMEDGEGTQEVVSEELQAGYTLGEEVIRHAMVKVKMA